MMIAVAELLAVSMSLAAPTPADMAAAEAVIRYEAALPGHSLEQSTICITVGDVDVGKDIGDRLRDNRLRIVPKGNLCQWIKQFSEVKEVEGQWIVQYGNFVYCENAAGQCRLAGKEISAVLEKSDAGWHVVRLVGGVNF